MEQEEGSSRRQGWVNDDGASLIACCICDTLDRMNKSAVVHARVEPQTKKQAESVLRKLGLTPTEAIRLFYRQICLHGGLPFPVLIPNNLTKQTLEKSRVGEDVETFDTLEDMFESWEQ